MSHELRTPLNAILGFGQVLELAGLPPRRHESVRQILKAGEHLLNLVNDVLDVSRIDAGNFSFSLEPIDLKETIQEALGIVSPLAERSGIRIDLDSPSLAGRWIRADRQRLKQVLINLISNAVKYNRAGGSVSLFGLADDEEGTFRIAVRDTGAGLSAEDIGNLFKPFERLGAAGTNIEGTGIGLALSRRLMEAMGGRIEVASIPRQGSTFWLEIPLESSPPSLDGAAKERRPVANWNSMAEPDLDQKTILYIEDNPANLEVIQTILEDWSNIQVLTAVRGETGLHLALERKPDLILLDVHLPDIDGHEVLWRLKADPATTSISVIVVSADATQGQIRRLMAAGADSYLTKPIDISILMKTVRDRLE
jgi:hypothetical protein